MKGDNKYIIRLDDGSEVPISCDGYEVTSLEGAVFFRFFINDKLVKGNVNRYYPIVKALYNCDNVTSITRDLNVDLPAPELQKVS